MLQQTQVATVIPYYERWMERFPTVEALAAADEQDVLSVWQGLGYYRRVRFLLAGSRWIAAHGAPSSALEWLKVPGVGKYTAAAIASIAFGEAVAVVDGNVERVFARFTGCELSGSELYAAAWDWAPKQMRPDRAGDWNQAMMELGATVCRPGEADCGICPLASACVAHLTGRAAVLPVAKKKTKAVQLHRHAAVYVWNDQFGLEQIPRGEWWESMWRFPPIISGRAIGTIRHVVTHHRIKMDVHLVSCDHPVSNLSWYTIEELKHLPMPAPQRRALGLALKALSKQQQEHRSRIG
jgi:A/G-specific adenine glycosylase